MAKYFLISLFSIIIFSCTEKEQVEVISEAIKKVPEILVESDMKLISKKPNGEIFFNGMPFSGYLISRYSNNSISLKKGYVDGKQNGTTTAYYDDGSVRYVRPYLHGEKHGTHRGYYRSGKQKFKYYFENGFNEGNHLEWYETGQKAADMNYVRGKEFGKQQAWRPDGKLRSNYIVRENGRVYGLQGIKRCTKLDGVTKTVDPYRGASK